jgi:SAM-dependent methyltransferase
MGFDVHSLNYFKYLKKHRDFGRTATLGRQAFFIHPDYIKYLLNLPPEYEVTYFCEKILIDSFGSTAVDSFDISDYEGCTYTEDFNNPLSRKYESYDTVIDGGSLEHIFNVPQVIKNLTELCKPGGQIIHIVPSNNVNGHGLYQFSSEFFYSVYDEKNGYTNTEVFYADFSFKITDKWWYARPVTGQERSEFNPEFPMYIMCRTTKADTNANTENVQSSDYEHRWGVGGREHNDSPLIVEIDVAELCKC